LQLFEGANLTANFDFAFAEVDEQADVDSGGGEVVHELNLMRLDYCPNRLEFDDHFSLNDQIGDLLADDLAFVPNRHWLLERTGTASRSKLNRETSFVNRFQKSKPKLIINLVCRTNDFLGYLVVLHTEYHSLTLNPVHPVHPVHSVALSLLLRQDFVEVQDHQTQGRCGGMVDWVERFVARRLADR